MDARLTLHAPTALAGTVIGLLDAWIEWERTKNDAAPMTLTAYRKGMAVFTAWLAGNGIGDVTPITVREFKSALKDRGYSVQTVNLRLTAIRRFYAWMVNEGKMLASPASEIKGLKRTKSGQHRRDALANGEVVAVLGTCNDTPEGLRDRAILSLMAYCGLRTIEVHRANIGDLKIRDERLVLDVQGKGRAEKDEFVVVPDAREDAIRAWLSYRMTLKDHGEGDPLFVSLSNASKGERLALSSLRGMVKARYAKVGVVGRKTTHSLRHSAITNAIRHGATPLAVQRFARHSSFDTTLAYYHEAGRLDNPVEDLIDYANGNGK